MTDRIAALAAIIATSFLVSVAPAKADQCWEEWDRLTLKIERAARVCDASVRKGKASCKACSGLYKTVTGLKKNSCYRKITSSYPKGGVNQMLRAYNDFANRYEEACKP